jgi:predicted esterase
MLSAPSKCWFGVLYSRYIYSSIRPTAGSRTKVPERRSKLVYHKTPFRINILRGLVQVIGWVAFVLTLPCTAQQLTMAEREAWSQKLTNLIPSSLEGNRTVQDLAALRPDDMYQLLADNWPGLSNADVKQYILSLVVQNDNSRILDVLHLGVMDSSLAVQNRSLQFCESFGFDSFTEDFNAYQEWWQHNEGKSLKDVINASMKSVVEQLPNMDESHRSSVLNILVRTNLTATSQTSRIRRDAALTARLPDALAPYLKQQNNFMWTSYQIIRNLRPDSEFIRRVILPLTDARVDTAVRYQALSALGSDQNTWAVAPLMKMMIAEYPDGAAEIIGQALAQIGDPRIIPPMIGIMESDNTPEGNRVIGNILTPLTGVSNAYVRDAVWWRAWWNRNSSRFPAEVRALPIPRLVVHARPAQGPGQNGLQEPARPTLHQIANDPKRAYWFIDPISHTGRLTQLTGRRDDPVVHVAASTRAEVREQPPPPPTVKATPQFGNPGSLQPFTVNDHAEEPGLIVVLTSDGDAASSAGFWNEAAAHGLGKQYYVAVVVAPKWTDNQQFVWLTAQDIKSFKEAKFTTETLVADVVRDVASTRQIDPNRVFLHGIGNGGSAVYSASLEEKSPFRGFYILSAAFRSSALPPLERAIGRRYLIQNGKDDRMHPYWIAEAAQKLFVRKGAVVRLEASTGYLGSQGVEAIMTQLKTSFDWLASGK